MRSRTLRFLTFLVTVITVLVLQPVTRAYSQGGGDLNSLLQNLTPDQQQAILDRVTGGGGLGGSLGNTGGSDQGQGSKRQGMQTDQNFRRTPPEDEEEVEPLIPVLRNSDWVVIEVDFHLKPRTIQPSSQILQALASPPIG